MTSLIKEAKEFTPHLVSVALHDNSAFSGSDPYAIFETFYLKESYGVLGFPTGVINRDEFWDRDNITPQVMEVAGKETSISLSINSQLENRKLTIDLSLISEENLQNKKITIFILENGLVYPQVNYLNEDPESEWYGLGPIIEDFVHNDVLRISLTDALGDSLPEINALSLFEKKYSVDIPTKITLENIVIVAIISDEDNKAMNAQEAHVGEFKQFE
ncbi:Omp28-related outer membrane protein [Patiriisocius marinus]|uniref:Omp28-related outer membrane protein n=1 Tax=Patiriisocius marinus TaxID=1397112 RepID=UPI00232F15DD|nr:Omp28-related outer membrane protein [Patiriisocius marinus]